MKPFFALLFVLNLGAVAVFSQKQLPPPRPLIYSAPDKSELREFIAEDKSFKITFPGVPKVEKRDVDNARVTIYRVYRQGSNSSVSVYEFRNDVEGIRDKAFELFKSSLQKVPKAKIEAERDVQVRDQTAKEFDVLEDLTFQKYRLLIRGKRMYELKNDVTNWPILSRYNKEKTAEFENETRRFFDSFELLDATQDNSVSIDFIGIFKESSYTNTFFGFSLDFPADWYIYDHSEIEERKTEGLEALKTNREKNDRALAESVKKEVIIFAISNEHLSEMRGESFMIGVIKLPDDRITAESVVTSTRDFLLTNPKIKLRENVKSVKIKGVDFSTVGFEITVNDRKISQKLLVTIRNGYSVNFSLSYMDETGLKSLEAILDSLKFFSK